MFVLIPWSYSITYTLSRKDRLAQSYSCWGDCSSIMSLLAVSDSFLPLNRLRLTTVLPFYTNRLQTFMTVVTLRLSLWATWVVVLIGLLISFRSPNRIKMICFYYSRDSCLYMQPRLLSLNVSLTIRWRRARARDCSTCISSSTSYISQINFKFIRVAISLNFKSV